MHGPMAGGGVASVLGGSTLASPSAPSPALGWPSRPPQRPLVIGCGALARELVALTRRAGFPEVDLTCLPATLHNRPERIPEAVRSRIRRARAAGRDRIFVAYADCGTGGLLDRVLDEEGVARLEGAHCYEVYAGRAAFATLAADEPGTFYLTDFLARNFDRLVIRGLGLDRHPELLPLYFGNYTPGPLPRPDRRRGADHEGPAWRATPGTGLRAALHGLRRAWQRDVGRCRSGCGGIPGRVGSGLMPGTLTTIWWRDIPAQVVAKDRRQAHKIVLHRRFQVAIDRAAMQAGKRSAGDYIEEWRREAKPCGDDLETIATAEAARLEAEYTRDVLARLVAAGGIDLDRTQPEDRPRMSITHTVVSSATREVVLGFDQPFVVIGERINPTGRKLLAEEMRNGDFSRVERDALAQVAAGAHMLDVNAGIPLADEPAILARTIQLVQSLVQVPLSIDSSIVEALEAGLAVYQGKPLVNSVTGEEERMERVLPLIRKYGAAVVAISNDDSGISEDPDVRFEVAHRIVERAADHGIPREDIVVDPLVMPIGAMRTAGQQVFRLVRRLREELA